MYRLTIVLLFGSMLCLFGCKIPTDVGPQILTVEIHHLMTYAHVLPDSYYSVPPNSRISFRKLKYILRDFRLINMDDTEIPLANSVFVIDALAAENIEGHVTVSIRNVPQGTYKGIRYKVGLDSALNRQENLPNANDLRINENSADGYYFLWVEGQAKSNGSDTGFKYRLATAEALTDVRLEGPITVTPFVRTVSINADFAKLFMDITLPAEALTTGSPSTDPLAAKVKKNLGGSIFSLVLP
jgi:hypothetical protein